MSMYGKYPKINGVEQVAKPSVDFSKEPSLTVQSDAKEADINSIVARFEKAGMITNVNKGEPFYGDVSEFNGLQNAIIKVQDANELFMTMSAKIRERFDNDPVKMIDFLADEENLKEAEELGMVSTPPEDKAAELKSLQPAAESAKKG